MSRITNTRRTKSYAAILRRDPCSYCNAPVSGTVDHILPLYPNNGSAAPGRNWENLTGACVACNRQKNVIKLIQFLLARRRNKSMVEVQHIVGSAQQTGAYYMGAVNRIEMPAGFADRR